jgi:CubicO group peptidase (beta-lactamase class C family)
VNPPKDSEEALSRIFDLPADFVPDTDYAYSNTNYLLLSELIGRINPEGKYAYFKESILDPLELEHTFVSKEQIEIDSLMSGYYVGIEADIKTANYGSMIATAQDVGLFLRVLNEGTIFGLGEKEIYDQIYVYEHTGLLPGYMSIAK